MSHVLITDGRSRASLAIVRSLGKKGIKIISGESFRVCSSSLSRYTNKRLIYPDPDKYPMDFVRDLYNYVKKNNIELILPVRDSITSMLSKFKQKFVSFTGIPTPEYDTLIKARDKAQTLQLAEELDIPHPETYFDKRPKLKQIKNEFNFPVILKPRESSGSRGIVYVESPNKLESEYKKVKSRYGPPIIQEFIPHAGAYGVSMLFNHGEPRASFTHKRLREYPISGGPSTLRESTKHPEAEKYATEILKALNWHGVAMVEFRVDARDNKPKLMEINPRFWGSLPLATLSGVDFPYLLYTMIIEGDIKPVFDYKVGVKCRWLLLGDILWFLDNPNKLKALPQFLKFKDQDLGYDILSLNDPLPALGAILEGFISLTKKRRREHAFKRGW